jgi:cytoplasmic iron level regulating protein YaaA (DUF328/UPF0246 family)
VLFLLPPSETKAKAAYPGARESALSVRDVSLAFGSLESARQQAANFLDDASVLDGPTMAAIDRYTGTLFSAVHGRGLKGTATEHAHLSPEAMARAKEVVLIQSALFGLIPATGLIPNYKLSATPTLKRVWSEPHETVFRRLQGPIIDMRSKAYVALAPIPDDVESYFLDVVLQDAEGNRTSMNHFNKKSKGELVHAVLNSPELPANLADLKRIANRAGFALEVDQSNLTLVVSHSG